MRFSRKGPFWVILGSSFGAAQSYTGPPDASVRSYGNSSSSASTQSAELKANLLEGSSSISSSSSSSSSLLSTPSLSTSSTTRPPISRVVVRPTSSSSTSETSSTTSRPGRTVIFPSSESSLSSSSTSTLPERTVVRPSSESSSSIPPSSTSTLPGRTVIRPSSESTSSTSTLPGRTVIKPTAETTTSSPVPLSSEPAVNSTWSSISTHSPSANISTTSHGYSNTTSLPTSITSGIWISGKPTTHSNHTHKPTSINSTITPCTTLSPGQPSTVFIVKPNTSTTTLTVYANASTSHSFGQIPEFTPPVYCPHSTNSATQTRSTTLYGTSEQWGATTYYSAPPLGSQAPVASSEEPIAVTVITTSKNPVTAYTTVGGFGYPSGVPDKIPTDPKTSSEINWGPIGPGPPGGFTPTSIPIATIPAPPANSPNPPSGGSNNQGANPGSGGNNNNGGGGGSSPPSNNPPSNNPPSNNPPSNSPQNGGNNNPSSNNNGGGSSGGSGSNNGGGGAGSGSGSGSNSGNQNSPNSGVSNTVIVGGVPVSVSPNEVSIGGQTYSVPGSKSGSGSGSSQGGNGSGGGSGGGSGSGGSGSGSGPSGGGNGSPGNGGSGTGPLNGNNEAPSANGGDSVTTNSNGDTVVVKDGQTFTINHSQVIASGTTIPIPTSAGAMFKETPETTVISGIPVQIGASQAVIAGTTYSIGPGAPQTTVVVNGQTISIGPGGLGFAQTTVAPHALPTNIVVVEAQVFSAIGPSIAVIDGSTFTYGGTIPTKTNTFNGATITMGPSGISYGSSSLGGPSNPVNTQLGIAGGLTITEIGSSIAVINGITLTIGPGVAPSTTVIDGHTITVGPSGLGLRATTLSFPFNPTTQAVTAGGITFSEIGPSLVVIGGTTYTIGPGAKPTTEVFNGQTISIGPGGVGFATTTVLGASTSTPTSAMNAKSTSKKSGAGVLKPGFGVWVAGFVICIFWGV